MNSGPLTDDHLLHAKRFIFQLFETEVDNVSDRDDAAQVAVAQHRHMAKTTLGHCFQNFIQQIIRCAGLNILGS